MQITVEAVSDIKTDQRGTSSKVKAADGKFYYANEDATKYVGKTIEGDVTEKTSAKGNKYNILNIKSEVASGQASSNGHGSKVEWKEYEALARVAHKLALELEPDDYREYLATDDGKQTVEGKGLTVDRSRARITFVNTALMALKDSKLWLDDDLPF